VPVPDVQVLSSSSVPDTKPLSDFPKARTLPASTRYVLGPHFAVDIDRVAVVDRIESAQAVALGLATAAQATQAIQAPPGRQFLVAHVGASAPGSGLVGAYGAGVTAAVVRGRKATPIDLPSNFSVFDEAVIVVQVAKGQPVSLRMTEGKRAQAIDLRTGKRDAPGLEYAFASGRSKAEVAFGVSILRAGLGDVKVKYLLSPVTSAGWAPKGRAWLIADIEGWGTGFTLAKGYQHDLRFTVGGQALKVVEAGEITIDSTVVPATTTSEIRLEVPTGIRSVTLSVGGTLHVTTTAGKKKTVIVEQQSVPDTVRLDRFSS
jgi:hypothetical protein